MTLVFFIPVPGFIQFEDGCFIMKGDTNETGEKNV